MILKDYIRIERPEKIKVNNILVERIPLGITNDYKPSITQLPDGELLLTAFYGDCFNKEKDFCESIIMFRSRDGGRTWSERQVTSLIGREPYFSVLKDGTLFITTHLLQNDIRNKEGYCYSYIHRSVDGGFSWDMKAIKSEDVGEDPKSPALTTRNILELKDGNLLFGVSGKKTNHTWLSKDKGETWEKYRSSIERIPEDYPFPALGETFLWETPHGRIIALSRVDSKYFPLEDEMLEENLIDHYQRMVIFETNNKGKSWKFVKGIGGYGEMYPNLIQLQNGSTLLTYTKRAMAPNLGVRAILAEENEEGLHFNYDSDIIIIDEKTSEGKLSGGGFGPTVQIKDGTLLTSYSYRGEDDNVYIEVVRWRLP